LISLFSEKRSLTAYHKRSVVEQVMASAKYDKPSILFREAIQNSCDAKQTDRLSISFSVELERLTLEQLDFLRGELFQQADELCHSEILDYLDSPAPELLYISDSGTCGLDGPFDPKDQANYGNFLNFFYVYGSNEDKDINNSGGAAGVGRTIFFNSSKAHTILVGTRVIHEGISQLRFMAYTSGPEVSKDGNFLTGRHWWGNVASSDEEYPMPLIAAEAEKAMQSLGMLGHLPSGDGCGTVIAILGPTTFAPDVEFDDDEDRETSLEIVDRMARAAEVFAWPHILDQTVEFHFSAYGQPVPVRDPMEIRPIRYYCVAYKNLQISGAAHQIQMTDRGKKTVLGSLAHGDWPMSNTPNDLDVSNEVIPNNSVALMRQARFVVKYMPIESRVNGIFTKGVFITNFGESDNIFRKSEPAAHDDWHPEKLGLPPGRTNPVRVAFNHIREYFRNQGSAETEAPSGSAAGDLARMFGSELGGAGSWGPASPETSGTGGGGGGGGGGGRRRTLSLIDSDQPRVLKREGQNVFIEFLFETVGEIKDGSQVSVSFDAFIVNSDGKIESSPPLGEEVPVVTEIRALPENSKVSEGAVFAKESMPTGFSVIVKSPDNALIGCDSTLSPAMKGLA
jgi:hypothetical protein